MVNVACFCGCDFSFEGSTRACPRCGEVATVRGGREPETAAFDGPDDTLLCIKDIWQTGEPVWPELDEARAAAVRR